MTAVDLTALREWLSAASQALDEALTPPAHDAGGTDEH